MINKIILVAGTWLLAYSTFYADTIEMVPKPFPAGYEPTTVNKTGTVGIPTSDSEKTQRIMIHNKTNHGVTALFAHKNPKGKLRDAVTIKAQSSQEIFKPIDSWFETKKIKENVTPSILQQEFPYGVRFSIPSDAQGVYKTLDPVNNEFTITEDFFGKLNVG